MEIHKIILQILVPHQEWPNKQNQTEIVIQININLIQNVMKSLKKLFTLLLISGIAFTSCDDIVDPVVVNPQDSEELKDDAVDNAKADEAMGGSLQVISSYGISEDWSKKLDGGDPTVTIDTAFVVTLTFANGGVITIDWNIEPTWDAIGLTGVLDIVNFNQNGTTINASGILLEKGGTVTEPTLHIVGTAAITIGNVETSLTMDRTFEWFTTEAGFAVYGTSELTKGSKIITTEILEAEKLIQYLACDYPQQGITKLAISGTNKSITMDYGIDENGVNNNQCDSWANLTIKIGNASITIKVDLSN